MDSFKIYLAGKMTGISYDQSNEWRVKAKKLLEETYCLYKVTAINPNDYYNFKEVIHKSEKEILRYDLHRVRTSNMILVNLTGDSIGTAMELQHAFDNHIPIIGYKEDKTDLHPWLEYVCDRVFDNLEEVVDYVNDYYLKE